MKLFFFIILFSCSSFKNPDTSGDGALDKALRDKDCGLLDKFYDGCKGKKSSTSPESQVPVED